MVEVMTALQMFIQDCQTRQDLFSLIAEYETVGFCTECGSDREGVEPDATGYTCFECGSNKVCGAEHLIICGYCE